MRQTIGFLLMVAGIGFSCKNRQIEVQEVAAVILNSDNRLCAQCGGTFVQIDTTIFNADVKGYAPNTPVWIRYMNESNLGGIKWIKIESIRKR